MSLENALDISVLRNTLIRLEETIIFGLIERAQFKQNQVMYLSPPNGLSIVGWDRSFVDFLLRETERRDAKVRRYMSPDEVPFLVGGEPLPLPVLPYMSFPLIITNNTININTEIKDIYYNKIVPMICASGDDGQYGSSSVCDVAILQALSKRIHYGKFIAESKYQKDVEVYTRLIKERNSDAIMEKLTDRVVEENLLKRVQLKSLTYGQEVGVNSTTIANLKISPQVVADVYENIIMPLTKKVELLYLLDRLNHPINLNKL